MAKDTGDAYNGTLEEVDSYVRSVCDRLFIHLELAKALVEALRRIGYDPRAEFMREDDAVFVNVEIFTCHQKVKNLAITFDGFYTHSGLIEIVCVNHNTSKSAEIEMSDNFVADIINVIKSFERGERT